MGYLERKKKEISQQKSEKHEKIRMFGLLELIESSVWPDRPCPKVRSSDRRTFSSALSIRLPSLLKINQKLIRMK